VVASRSLQEKELRTGTLYWGRGDNIKIELGCWEGRFKVDVYVLVKTEAKRLCQVYFFLSKANILASAFFLPKIMSVIISAAIKLKVMPFPPNPSAK